MSLAVQLGSTPVTGTLVVLVLILASIGLFFALTRSLRKVPPQFPPPREDPPEAHPER